MRNKTTRRRKLASSKLFAITSIISASFRLSKYVNAKATNPTAKLQDRHPRQAYAKKVAGDIDKPFMSSTGCRSEKPLASAKRITLNTNRRFNHVSFLLVLSIPKDQKTETPEYPSNTIQMKEATKPIKPQIIAATER